VGLAQAGAGDQQHRKGDQVAADHELELGAAGPQFGGDGRRGDVGDGRVGLRHERRDEQDRE